MEADFVVQDDGGIAETEALRAANQSETSAPDNKAPDHRRHNPLTEYSSQTYQLVLAMITPEAYVKFVKTGRKSLNFDTSKDGVFLIAQSGGINNTTSTRASGFEFDYYIDDLKITAAVDTASTGAPVCNTSMSFNIIEPYGFSFVTKLKEAAKQVAAASATPGLDKQNDATKSLFILGIRFLGYDKDGKIIENSQRILDRYYDINFTELKFDLDGRTVTYKIKAVTIPISVGAGTKRGIINHESTITGRTIEDVLDQLMKKLSKDQQPVKPEGEVISPALENTYSVVFRGPGSDLIKNAIIVSKADPDKQKWPMGIVASEGPDSTQRTVTFKTGTPILQAVGQLISQSSYLEDALKVVFPSDDIPVDRTGDPEEMIPDTKKRVKWFNVTMEVTPKAWNAALKDFTFDIVYVIQPYLTPMSLSPLINNTTPYYGPIKRYDYWYTGKNSEVLRFAQTFNTAYFSVTLREDNVSAPASGSSPISYAPGKRQEADRLGKTNVGAEAASSYVTSLYDPSAWVQMKMDILGDPDWLVNDGAPPVSDSEYNSFYGPNGFTINPTGAQIFIEINFYEAVDYDNQTGLLKINDKIMIWDYPPEVLAENNAKGVCYKVYDVASSFNGGIFKQTLTGVLNPFNQSTKTASTDQRNADAPKTSTPTSPASVASSAPNAKTSKGDGDFVVYDYTS